MTQEKIEEVYAFLKTVSVNIVKDTDLVDAAYLTQILGECDDFTQKIEEYITDASSTIDQLGEILSEKQDLYKASLHDVITTDESVKSLSTGKERLDAAEVKLRDAAKEIVEIENYIKKLTTLKETLTRRVRKLSSSISIVKKQYDAKIDSIRNFNLGERQNTDALPNSNRGSSGSVVEDDSLNDLLSDVSEDSF